MPALTREAVLKRKLRWHLKRAGFEKAPDGSLLLPRAGKETIRALHQKQRNERTAKQMEFLKHSLVDFAQYFAAGTDIVPERIDPVIERIYSDTKQSDLFKIASLTWSVPVSSGFGRRLRYLVWDRSNGKLIGLLAIGDPVFNLGARDTYLGWSGEDRKTQLVNLMDAYVLGAVPPYNQLLCGKLVASLLRTQEIYDEFQREYGHREGIISGQVKSARLVAVTTTSSMGRSSVYNRLKLGDTHYLRSIGYSNGYGHFHIPDKLFQELREHLRIANHRYADDHSFGQGPNWKMRTTRTALESLGFKSDILKHGVRREVFISELAYNAKEFLRGEVKKPKLGSLLPVSEVAALALNRWVIPRSISRPEFQTWKRSDLASLILGKPSVGLTQLLATAC